MYREDLATKADLAKVEFALKSDLGEFKGVISADIASLRELIASTQNRTLIWMFSMMVTFTGVIIAVTKLA